MPLLISTKISSFRKSRFLENQILREFSSKYHDMFFRTVFFLENSVFLQNKSFRPRKVGKSCSMIELSLIRLAHRFLQHYLLERIHSWRAFSSRTLTPIKEFQGKSDTSACINSLPIQRACPYFQPRIPILAEIASRGIKLLGTAFSLRSNVTCSSEQSLPSRALFYRETRRSLDRLCGARRFFHHKVT